VYLYVNKKNKKDDGDNSGGGPSSSKYSCNQTTNECVIDVNGTYNNLQSCVAECKTSPYKCDPGQGCVGDDSSPPQYTSLDKCTTAGCKITGPLAVSLKTVDKGAVQNLYVDTYESNHVQDTTNVYSGEKGFTYHIIVPVDGYFTVRADYGQTETRCYVDMVNNNITHFEMGSTLHRSSYQTQLIPFDPKIFKTKCN
jgi:hypothetical protein